MNKKFLAILGLSVGMTFLGACGDDNDGTDNSVPIITTGDTSIIGGSPTTLNNANTTVAGDTTMTTGG